MITQIDYDQEFNCTISRVKHCQKQPKNEKSLKSEQERILGR
jgi:hypothetical protein